MMVNVVRLVTIECGRFGGADGASLWDGVLAFFSFLLFLFLDLWMGVRTK